MQMIFQDPMACLNPRKKVKEIIAQGLRIHHDYKSEKELTERVYQIFGEGLVYLVNMRHVIHNSFQVDKDSVLGLRVHSL